MLNFVNFEYLEYVILLHSFQYLPLITEDIAETSWIYT